MMNHAAWLVGLVSAHACTLGWALQLLLLQVFAPEPTAYVLVLEAGHALPALAGVVALVLRPAPRSATAAALRRAFRASAALACALSAGAVVLHVRALQRATDLGFADDFVWEFAGVVLSSFGTFVALISVAWAAAERSFRWQSADDVINDDDDDVDRRLRHRGR